jgi:predicted NUDIX family NTP pyrophosphohydrolase
MAPRPSAGLLLHRAGATGPEVLLTHLGGPYWAGKDERAWSIPKGELVPGEDPLDAARREFAEELGLPVPDGELRPLGDVQQRAGKTVTAWALAADIDVATVTSNTFDLEWPPRSGRVQQFPEVDRAAWFDLAAARPRIIAAQAEFLDRLQVLLAPP